MTMQQENIGKQASYGLKAIGFRPVYRAGTINHCPGCSRSQWHIGRTSAECAHCGTAIPLADIAQQPMRPLFYTSFSRTAAAA